MTKKDAINQLMKQYPRDFRRSKAGRANEKFFNDALECKTYIWPEAGLKVEHTGASDYKITKVNPIRGLGAGQGIIVGQRI